MRIQVLLIFVTWGLSSILHKV